MEALERPRRDIDLAAVEKVTENINAMIGLDNVKDELETLIDAALVDAYNAQSGAEPRKGTMHLIFEGQPGTGKTTVAKEIAQLYYALGLVPTNRVKEVGRAELVHTHVGNTAKQVQRIFYGDEKTGDKPGVGGVIFIDEAYALYQGKDDNYGKEAIAELLKLVARHKNDTVVILAGYSKGNETIGNLMSANPGLSSRFPRTLTFPPYTPAQRLEIAYKKFGDAGKQFAPKTQAAVRSALKEGIALTGEGNARDVENLVSDVLTEQKARLGRRIRAEGYRPTARDNEVLTIDDVRAGVRRYGSGRR